MIIHPFPPLFDADSRILILGSFPSVKSREQQFFYGHPQNRFWQVLASVFETAIPQSIPEKRAFLQARRIALWDVLAACDIQGSADSTIKNATANDLMPIIKAADIRQIFVNGKTAEKYFIRYTERTLGRKALCLPSTSPANAAWRLPQLVEAWQVIRDFL
ncbi:MAG: DNA-deoxyinosine glycosylase [Ruminococcaceae bacterium]|nr:DNA-deoxyinosine glycosylase [Oscillospiraceae bacterium]